MSYRVLARKWRPGRFQDLVGQDHVTRALCNALTRQRLHHAYLFAGTRGVGKTTLARILAKAMNCQEGIRVEPCGQCPSCQEIDEGRSIDLIEVDAASRTRVDETRELLDNVQYAPSRDRFKVYLIDEVHMFSNHSFNALLKTLEEPPPHVKFMLATTDPKKLPVTILSRCLQFNLKHVAPEKIAGYLDKIMRAEGTESETGAMHLIALAAQGSVRDALSLLDQAIAYSGGKVKIDDVSAMLGSIDANDVFTLLDHVVNGDASAVVTQIQSMAEFGPDYAAALDTMLGQLQRVATQQLVPDYVDAHHLDQDNIKTLATKMTPEDCQLLYQVALVGRRDLDQVTDPRSGFEMILLRMLAFRRETHGNPGKPPQTAVNTNNPPASPSNAMSSDGNQKNAILDWRQQIDALTLPGMVRELALNSVFEGFENDQFRLMLSPDYPRNEKIEQRLEESLKSHFGTGVRLLIDVQELGDKETPKMQSLNELEQQRQSAEESIKADPQLREICERFGATIDPASIKLH